MILRKYFEEDITFIFYILILIFMSQFWTKYIVRVAKITSLIALCHKTFNDYSAGTVSSDNALFYTIMGIITITTGITKH